MTGLEMPRLGFGTWRRSGSEGREAILSALETGYRHLDTAQAYGNEREVGEALRASGLPREEVFVTTKIAPDHFGHGRLVPSLEASLERLGIGPVDLTLIHWPSGTVPLATYLDQLAEAKVRGLTRLIGVSNFTVALLDEAASILGAGEIAANQIELNPLLQNRRVAEHCRHLGITVTCYLPIARGRLGAEPAMAEIAARHDASPEQIAIAWELAQGYATIPSSSRPDRIRANFAATGITLGAAEMAAIAALDRDARTVNPAWAPDWDG